MHLDNLLPQTPTPQVPRPCMNFDSSVWVSGLGRSVKGCLCIILACKQTHAKVHLQLHKHMYI